MKFGAEEYRKRIKCANINIKNAVYITLTATRKTLKTAKVMNGDIIREAVAFHQNLLTTTPC